MYEATEQSSAPHRQAGETRRPSREPVPGIVWYGAQFGWRHVKRVAVIRALVALWLVILASIFCALGHWWGASLYVVAGLDGWLAYQVPRTKLALDAKKNGPDSRTFVVMHEPTEPSSAERQQGD